MHAPQADHAEEVLDVVLPAGHQPAKVMEPSEKSLDSPPSTVATRRATILRRFVANQSCWKAVEEAVPEDAFDKLAFVLRSALDTNGERKTVIIGESDDFRPFATLGGPDRKAPFFAPAP